MTGTATLVDALRRIVGRRHVLTGEARTRSFRTGYRFGGGPVAAVVRPATLVEQWRVLNACVAADVIVIAQAANTGLTGGSTPDGDYDRPVVIVSTRRIDGFHLIDAGRQVVCLPGTTLYALERALAPLGREPHSVIGSSCIGASVVGGICNNSGGALVRRGPAYTEYALYARIAADGSIALVNHLGIRLGNDPETVLAAVEAAASADGLVEGFRPGVMERLGLGPEDLLAANPRLVVGRMTGWGQDGPYAPAAGHDINYIALAGALHAFGRAGEKPTPPINMVGDFGGGGMMLAFGMVSALLHARRTGRGQVIDCAMTDGSALLMSMIWSLRAAGAWSDERGTNLLDSGSPFYDTYETADGRFVSIGSIEPQFYRRLCERLGLGDDVPDQMDRGHWPARKERLADLFRTRTRDEWCALLEPADLCFAPVLSMEEAPDHPHHNARRTFLNIGGVVQPAPAPRFSETPAGTPMMPADGSATAAIMADIGFGEARIAALRAQRVVD